MLGNWTSVVGHQIADHAVPTALKDGVLSVSAESTAWATQLRMIQAQLLAKIAAAVGNGVVTSLKITGRPRRRGARGRATSPGEARATPTVSAVRGAARSPGRRLSTGRSNRPESRRHP